MRTERERIHDHKEVVLTGHKLANVSYRAIFTSLQPGSNLAVLPWNRFNPKIKSSTDIPFKVKFK